jgi:nitric oxide dioxygenase
LDVSTLVAYSQPNVGDVLGEDYDTAGRVDMPMLLRVLDTSPADDKTKGLKCGRFYICGPPAFVSSIGESLQNEDVASSRIYWESF